jgi:hypothetical protein
MDLLSTISMATKRRGDYLSQAERLAKKYKTQPALEQGMAQEAMVITKGLRDKQLRFEEYQRSLVDKTLISALAGLYLGTSKARPKEKMEKAWPAIVGKMLPPLVKFLNETEVYLNDGTLRQGDKTLEFDEFERALENYGDIEDPEVEGEEEANRGTARGKTWPGLNTRVTRYLATPTFSFYSLGEYMVMKEQGFSEMRRVVRKDKKTCKDCLDFGRAGWAPIGEIPMPGEGCRCYDHCRCAIEYR